MPGGGKQLDLCDCCQQYKRFHCFQHIDASRLYIVPNTVYKSSSQKTVVRCQAGFLLISRKNDAEKRIVTKAGSLFSLSVEHDVE
jgi:hypothetical protein